MAGLHRWLRESQARNMARLADHERRVLGTFWGVEPCKANSTYITVSVISCMARIKVKLSEIQNLGVAKSKSMGRK